MKEQYTKVYIIFLYHIHLYYDVGVSFLGYTYKVNNNKLIIKYNKKTIGKINKKLKYLKKHNYRKYILSLDSYKGYFKRSNTKLKTNICAKK